MTEEARVPDSDTDWQAIDIFVFSNGQQYSPPRKYHLRASDLNLWDSTLKFVAKTQYGPFETSMVDLYTLEGRKLVGPLELGQGASYVAVAPQDAFVDAGYEKYLIRASRSWEKRQAKKAEDVVKLAEKTLAEIEHNDVKVDDPYIKSQDESIILKTIESGVANADSSVIVKPKATLTFLRKHNLGPTTTTKPRPSVQRPAIIRKITQTTPPSPNIKPLCKKKDSIKPTNVKITRPEANRRSSSASGNNQDNKPSVKGKMFISTIRPRGSSTSPEVLLPKVQKVTKALKSPSIKKISIDHRKLSTNSTDLKDVVENKEIVLISNLYQNPRRELPSIAVNPIPAVIDSLNKNDIINVPKVEKHMNLNEECIRKNSIHANIKTEKVLVESYPIHSLTHKVEGNTFSDNKIKMNTSMSNEIITIQESLPHLVAADKLSDNRYESHNDTERSEINLNNDLIISASKSKESIKYNSLPTRLPVNVEKTYNLPSNATGKPLNDQYVAILKKGDVVNLKFNIEIENRDGSSITGNNDNYHSATNIHTEQGSQINIDDLIIAQNKSLLSLIGIGDNHRVIIFQNSGCKYCNNKRSSDKKADKSFMIILPVEKVEENMERCYCSQTHLDIRQASLENPIKSTHSCTSLERMTKPNQTALQNVCSPDTKTSENVTTDTVSVPKKKSVAINEESKPNSRQQSRISIISQEINIKSQLLAISMESVATNSKPIMDKSTQTEWCNVLLEARLLEDGHYTFHLPPLELLKYYKLV